MLENWIGNPDEIIGNFCKNFNKFWAHFEEVVDTSDLNLWKFEKKFRKIVSNSEVILEKCLKNCKKTNFEIIFEKLQENNSEIIKISKKCTVGVILKIYLNICKQLKEI